jgi:hypothetical protein
MSCWNENSHFEFGAHDVGNMDMSYFPYGHETPISQCWAQIRDETEKHDKECPGRRRMMKLFKALIEEYVELYKTNRDKFFTQGNSDAFIQRINEIDDEGLKLCKDVSWEEHIEWVIDEECYKLDEYVDDGLYGWGQGTYKEELHSPIV